MILVDTHVHIHPAFRLGAFMDAAAANFDSAARGRAGADSRVLCLAESAGRDCFGELRAGRLTAADGGEARWSFTACRDGLSLRADGGAGRRLWIAAGRQVASRDGLEVLALCTKESFADRALVLDDLIDTVLRAGAIAVVPWGAGKWWGRRGRILAAALRKGPRGGLFLGDNGGRPAFWEPGHFDIASARGIRILAGSDPLPFRRECGRAGGCGVALEGELDPEAPAAGLKSLLADPAAAPAPYGRRESALRFARNQIAMQLFKMFGRNAAGGGRE